MLGGGVFIGARITFLRTPGKRFYPRFPRVPGSAVETAPKETTKNNDPKKTG